MIVKHSLECFFESFLYEHYVGHFALRHLSKVDIIIDSFNTAISGHGMNSSFFR
jgi:hypothetical protein